MTRELHGKEGSQFTLKLVGEKTPRVERNPNGRKQMSTIQLENGESRQPNKIFIMIMKQKDRKPGTHGSFLTECILPLKREWLRVTGMTENIVTNNKSTLIKINNNPSGISL